MAYSIKRGENPNESLSRIAGEQIQKALDGIEDSALPQDEIIHKARKHCKKIRGLVRLYRPHLGKTYRNINNYFKNAAALLAPLRDADTMLNTFDMLLEEYKEQLETQNLEELRRILGEHREKLHSDNEYDPDLSLSRFKDKMETALKWLDDWEVDTGGFDAFSKGLKKTYSRARKAMNNAFAEPSPVNIHEWRKRTKYHWYHTRLVKPLWKQLLKQRGKEVHRLSDILGEDHDYAVLGRFLLSNANSLPDDERLQLLISLIDTKRSLLEEMSKPLGLRIFAENKKQFCRRLEEYWRTWKEEKEDISVEQKVSLLELPAEG